MQAASVEKMRTSCFEASRILKSLAHPQRLLVLSYLLQGPKTVGEIVKACDASQSQVSQFLMRMKLEGLVQSEKDGSFVSYSVSDRRLRRLIKVIQKEYCNK